MTITTSASLRPTLAALLAATVAAGSLTTSAFAQAPAGAPERAPTPIAELRAEGDTIVRGEIAEIFGNKIILRDATGRTLVDFGPRLRDAGELRTGQTITVEGRFDDGSIERASLVPANGSPRPTERAEERRGDRDERRAEERRDRERGEGRGDRDERRADERRDGKRGEARGDRDERRADESRSSEGGESRDSAELIRTVEAAGFTNARVTETKKRHAEIMARDSEGRDWELHVTFDGEIRKRERVMASLTPDQVRDLVTKAGYTFEGGFEQKKKHVEAMATNDRGERVEVHIDAEGEVRKEERVF